MTDINDLVQEFWRTPNDGAVGTSFFAMRRLFEILQWYFICVFLYYFRFATDVELADKIPQANPPEKQ